MTKLIDKSINLAQPRLGAKVTYATDDFFAPKERLILPSDPVFIADKYDDNGKWMDGWESRRKRTEGYDHCIIRLGRMGVIDRIDLDTSHFTGNHAPAASIDACISDQNYPDDADWQNIVPVTPMNGDSHNILDVSSTQAWTHLRLNIFPDGGVARMRVYGHIVMDWAAHSPAEVIDLAALEYGGRPIFANDQHFGRLENIIAPGVGLNMGMAGKPAAAGRRDMTGVFFSLPMKGTLRKSSLIQPTSREITPTDAFCRRLICQKLMMKHWPANPENGKFCCRNRS
jgi:allantoicase